ncbi:hypothetical protein AWQ23_12330 [Picosynechococcus sp. PCC 73109]|nr:hypothetical protein AWQ23_12330 [Picosynechococcus sp. PCC 73109]
MMGIELYALEFEAQLAYPEGWNTDCLGRLSTIEAVTSCLMPGRQVRREPGEQETATGKVNFEKTENGWRGSVWFDSMDHNSTFPEP